MARQEDFLFAERALQRGYATEAQVQECLSLLDRLRAEMNLEESLANLMVKKGYLAPAQAHVLEAEIDPNRPDKPKNRIEGYQLLERIGSGAMGSVYKAHHLKLDIPVALKVLNPSLASSKTQIERLKREARLAARLNHPNVVRCLDVGESNGFHYLVMEFVEGKTVRDLMEKGPLGEKEALAIVREVASGLAHAHAQGVVHRDVKPGNIMLTSEGAAKLADFGLARGQEPSDLTLEHASIGTPQYVAPEQMQRGADATARSDLFSLGATLYHMVTGRPPFDGERLSEIVQNVLACRFPPPESLAPGLSRDTIYVIGRLMRSNPRERYASAGELVADLDRIERQEPIAPPDFLGDYQAFLRKRRSRRNAILAGCAVVLVCAGAFLYQRRLGRLERTERQARCAVAASVGNGVDAVATVAGLGDAVAAMEKADAGAKDCSRDEIEPLRKRLAVSRVALGALQIAEAAAAAANSSDANYGTLDASLSGLRTGLAGVDRRIAAIRGEIRRASDEAALARYNRYLFGDAEEMMREVRAFAHDLEGRYLALDAPWVGDVAQAPRLLDNFEREWQQLDGYRRSFDAALKLGSYEQAAKWLDLLRSGEARAKDALFKSDYLSRFQALFAGNDTRENDLRVQEANEWENVILPAVASLMEGTEPRPDTAEQRLQDFLRNAHATREAVKARRDAVRRRREELDQEQLASYASDEALFENRLRERRYVKAQQDVVAVADSARWLKAAAARYRALAERAAAVADLSARFLDGARRQKKVKIRKTDGEVAGKDIDAAPGDDRDLFVARRGKETLDFTLADLDLDELERIFAFDPGIPRDRTLSGWFHAAEAFREDAHDPYKAEELRRKAQVELSKDDPWMTDVEAALEETLRRIERGESRAAQAWAEKQAAFDKHQNLKELSLCRELLALRWTKFCQPRMEELEARRKKLERIANRQLLSVQNGVPDDQVRYDGSRATIRYTGTTWYPADVAADVPDRVAQLTQLSLRYWEDWFRSEGKTEKTEIDELVARAMTQRLAWRGSVDVGPEGGYLPGADARIGRMDEWLRREKPLSLGLDFPFLVDQDWTIECEIRWKTPQPGYFVLAAGQIQAIVGYYDTGKCGGMAGACLVTGEDPDPAAHAKELADFHWHLVFPRDPEERKRRPRLKEGGEEAYLDHFVEGVPYFMRLQRTKDTVVFEMGPLGVPKEKQREATVRLEKRFPDPRRLDRLVTLADGRALFRFFGAPLPYELREVTISGALEKPDVD